MRSEAERERSFSRRAVLLAGGQAAVGIGLAARMTWLAVAENDHYAGLAESNRVTQRLIPPRRGWIVDRGGKPLALNRPSYGIELIPELAGDINAAVAAIADLVPLSPEDIARIAADIDRLPRSASVLIAADIGWTAFAAANVRLADIPGVQATKGFARAYPDGAAFGHLLGYVGAPTPDQFKATRDPLLIYPGFKVGKDGIERAADVELRGAPGARRIEMTARGRILHELPVRVDKPGQPVKLTIDRDLQTYAARRIDGESASVVVVDCLTGELLCLLSSPAYDPNVFSEHVPRALWADLMADDHHPLINKSVAGLYPPGSTFKLMTSLAIQEAGFSPDSSVVCTGTYRLGNSQFHCHKRHGHGHVNMLSAIYQSCDVWFYHYSRQVGPDKIAAMARRFGLGSKYDLPVPTQRKGIVPDSAWKLKRYKQPWLEGETLNIAIGQGYLTTNPLQLAVMAARVASGLAVEPHLIAAPRPQPASLRLPPEHLALVRQGMFDVVNGPGGTAHAAKLMVPGVQLAAKTGTAQVRRISMAERAHGVIRNDALPWKQRDHALFVAFAPVENPRYAVSVVVEHGSAGGKVAGPIARDVVTYLYDRDRAEKTLAPIAAERERKKRAAEEQRARESAAEAAALAAAENPPAPQDAPAPDTGERGD